MLLPAHARPQAAEAARAQLRVRARRRSCSCTRAAATAARFDEVTKPFPWDAAFCSLFLSRYWQRRPVLLRQALPGFRSLLDADELAGLACDTPSRIILEQGGARPWELRRGPFKEEEFAALPETHWTLLVNGVDRLVPHVADELLRHLSFLPRWRIDDIQVSYAPQHGSVGAHSDQYDVFLLQANGRKAWALSDDPQYGPRSSDAFLPGLDVAVLRDFVPQQSFVLQPGDVLYLPPGVAHHGVALDEGFTYSVGFLAPTRRELFLSWASAGSDADPHAAERWADPWLTPAERPGQLSAEAVDAAVELIASLPQSRADVAAWFGCHVTTPRDGGQEPLPLEEAPAWEWVLEQAAEAGELCRHESSRFAFLAAAAVAPGQQGGTLFVDGRSFPVSSKLACALAAEVADARRLPWERLLALGVPSGAAQGAAQAEQVALLTALLTDGLIFIPTDEEEEDGESDADEQRVEEIDLEDESDDEDQGVVV